MAELQNSNLRNISIVGHGSTGKTTLTSALLFDTQSTSRLLKVDEGNTVTDFDDEEIRRKITISSAMAHFKQDDVRVNLFDTPGFGNFIQDAKNCISVCEASLIIVCGVSGVEVQTERVFRDAEEYGAARAFFINKLDRERASFETTLQSINDTFDINAAPVFYPIGQEGNFAGIIDLFYNKAYTFDAASGEAKETAIPDDLKDKAEELRGALIESIVENDEELMDQYLSDEAIAPEKLLATFAKAFHQGILFPVFCGSALNNIGVSLLPRWIGGLFPAPGQALEMKSIGSNNEESPLDLADGKPFLGYVFKTTSDPFTGKITYVKILHGTLATDSNIYNRSSEQKERVGQLLYLMGKSPKAVIEVKAGDICAVAKLKTTNTGDTIAAEKGDLKVKPVFMPEPIMSFAIEPKSKKDEDKISAAITRLNEEDPTFRYTRDEQTNELIISGMGQQHVEVIVSKLKNKYNVDVSLKPPKVPYKETIKGKAKAHGRYKKQTGGRGQFGDCHIEIEPQERGVGFEFVNNIVGGAIPRQYIPAVEKGVIGAMEKGILAGYPVVDIKVTLYDGSFHPVDSSEIAFKIAGSMAFKQAFDEAKPVMLEPYMKLSVVVPEDFMGDIAGDISSKRGRVMGMTSKKGKSVVEAVVPLAELFSYSNELKSMTGGRGSFNMEFSHYEEVPAQIAEKIVEKLKKDEE